MVIQALYCTVSYCIVLYCIVLYCIVLYCIVLYNDLFSCIKCTHIFIQKNVYISDISNIWKIKVTFDAGRRANNYYRILSRFACFDSMRGRSNPLHRVYFYMTTVDMSRPSDVVMFCVISCACACACVSLPHIAPLSFQVSSSCWWWRSSPPPSSAPRSSWTWRRRATSALPSLAPSRAPSSPSSVATSPASPSPPSWRSATSTARASRRHPSPPRRRHAAPPATPTPGQHRRRGRTTEPPPCVTCTRGGTPARPRPQRPPVAPPETARSGGGRLPPGTQPETVRSGGGHAQLTRSSSGTLLPKWSTSCCA